MIRQWERILLLTKTQVLTFLSVLKKGPIMDTPLSTAPTQGVETALHVLGGKWKVLILWHLMSATQRYGALRRVMPQIAEKMLIRQLRELERDGIVTRTSHQSVPPRVEYSMTEYGRSLSPILTALCQWGWLHLQQHHDVSV
jgi:DNA-binding HxlR family transcriptional regulator